METKYVVSDVEDICLKKVLDEAGSDAVILSCAKDCLFLKKVFLDMFVSEDEVRIAGHRLNEYWGCSQASVRQVGSTVTVEFYKGQKITGWKGVTVMDIQKAIDQLEAARNYRRRLTFSVTPV
jgi:hypothetical protein